MEKGNPPLLIYNRSVGLRGGGVSSGTNEKEREREGKVHRTAISCGPWGHQGKTAAVAGKNERQNTTFKDSRCEQAENIRPLRSSNNRDSLPQYQREVTRVSEENTSWRTIIEYHTGNNQCQGWSTQLVRSFSNTRRCGQQCSVTGTGIPEEELYLLGITTDRRISVFTRKRSMIRPNIGTIVLFSAIQVWRGTVILTD